MPVKGAKTELFAKWLSGTLAVTDEGLSTGRRFFLNSVTGTDAGGYGSSPDRPVATLDYAVGLCTANKGDIIYVMPNHAESEVEDASIATLDVAGIYVIGQGSGADRATFSLEHINATITIGALNVTVRNIVVVSGIAACVAGFTLTTGVSCNFTLDNCVIKDGGTDVLELITGVAVATNVDNILVTGNEFLTVEGGAVTSAITFAGTHDNSRILNNYMNGDFATAAIVGSVGAGTRCLIQGNQIKVKDGEPGIELKADTTGIISHNNIDSTGAVVASGAIVAADCAWFENYCVNLDGETGGLTGAASTG